MEASLALRVLSGPFWKQLESMEKGSESPGCCLQDVFSKWHLWAMSFGWHPGSVQKLKVPSFVTALMELCVSGRGLPVTGPGGDGREAGAGVTESRQAAYFPQ